MNNALKVGTEVLFEVLRVLARRPSFGDTAAQPIEEVVEARLRGRH